MKKLYALIGFYIFNTLVFADDSDGVAGSVLKYDMSQSGLLGKSDDVKNAVITVEWILIFAGAIPSVVLLLIAGRKFSREEYGSALASGIGSILMGSGAYIASNFLR